MDIAPLSLGVHASVISYGADPTGGADSGPAFLAACFANPGATIDVPRGVYLWNSSQTFKQPCMFAGEGWNERNGGAGTDTRLGTWIVIDNPAITPITLDYSGFTGFERIAFEQKQPLPAKGWAPTAYPPIFTLGPNLIGEFRLNDLYFWGVYDAVAQAASNPTIGHLFMDHIRGQVFHSVFSATTSLDMIHADDWHIWPYWSNAAPVMDWQQANGFPIVLQRQDGWQSDHLFFYAANTCVTLGQKTSGANQGPVTNFDVGDLYCDAVKYGIRNTGNGTTAHIGKLTVMGQHADGKTQGMYPGSVGYLDEGSGTTVAIDRFVSQGEAEGAIKLTSPNGAQNLKVGSAFVANPNEAQNGEPVFFISASAHFSTIQFATQPDLVGAFISVPNAVANGNAITNVWQTWTPTLHGDGASAGTATYGNQKGLFIIQGGEVTATAYVGAGLHGASGNLRVGGLPLPNRGGLQADAPLGTMSNTTLDPGYTWASVGLNPNETELQLLESGPAKPQRVLSAATGTATPPTIGFTINYRGF